MAGAFPLSDDTIKALAPCNLPFLRRDPFVRSGSSMSIAELPLSLQDLVRRLYNTLLRIYSSFDQKRTLITVICYICLAKPAGTICSTSCAIFRSNNETQR